MDAAVPPTSPTPVVTRPSDNLGGRTINVGTGAGDLQTAINASSQGDTLVCPAGVTYNHIVLPIRPGLGWTCIRTNSASLPAAATRVGPSYASQMFKVTSSGSDRAVVIPKGTQGWRFIGMEATHPNAKAQFGLIDADGARMSFERCYIHGHPDALIMRRCFFVRGNDFQIWDSWISEAWDPDSDSQALFTRNNARLHVENCEIQGAGENIMLGDEGSATQTLDAVFKRNHFCKPLTWRRKLVNGSVNPIWDAKERVVKNVFEIKTAYRVLFEGNVLENHWAYSQPGDCLLINSATNDVNPLDCRDLMYRSNIIKNTPWFMATNTYTANALPLTRVAVLNNLGLEVGGRFFLFLHRCHDLWVEHNTVVPMRGGNVAFPTASLDAAMFFAWDHPATDFPRLTIKNNVFGKASLGIVAQSAAFTDASLDVWVPDRTWAGNAEYDMAGASPVTGLTYYASDRAAGVSLASGQLTKGSPLIRAGSDGKDIGVDFVALDAAHKPAGVGGG